MSIISIHINHRSVHEVAYSTLRETEIIKQSKIKQSSSTPPPELRASISVSTMKATALITAISAICSAADAFQIGQSPTRSVASVGSSRLPNVRVPLSVNAVNKSPTRPPTQLHASDDSAEGYPSKAESILDSFHKSDLTFRIVVIGNGAILETTSKLGPTSKSSISPKSGERLLTFASEDKSFEFHVKIEQVCTIAFVVGKRRVGRFLNENGTPICSLILVDEDEEKGEKWFDGLVEEYGNEVAM